MAWSSRGLYKICFFPRKFLRKFFGNFMRLPSIPQEAETTTFGSESSIRVASSSDENPPNTTE